VLSREDLLESLKLCKDEESRTILVCGQNGNNPLFLANLSLEEQSRVKALLLALKKESESHVKTYEQLIASIEASEQDVF